MRDPPDEHRQHVSTHEANACASGGRQVDNAVNHAAAIDQRNNVEQVCVLQVLQTANREDASGRAV